MTNVPTRLPASREVEWVMRFALKLAHERDATRLAIRDLLAGIYLSAFERLMRYWDQWEHLEDFLVSECDLYKPRLLYWVELCNLLISGSVPEGLTAFEEEAGKVFRDAEALAVQYSADEIKLEHLLGAVAENRDSGMCQKFVATGMNIDLVRSRTRK